jgi:hypothetical protein
MPRRLVSFVACDLIAVLIWTAGLSEGLSGHMTSVCRALLHATHWEPLAAVQALSLSVLHQYNSYSSKHYPSQYLSFKTRRFGDRIVSLSAGVTYSIRPNRQSYAPLSPGTETGPMY